MIRPSNKASRTKNPIRNIVDNLKPPVNHPKPFLNLALGDPTLYGNLKCPAVLQDALQECLKSSSYDGYAPSIGTIAARNAIAERVSAVANSAIARSQNIARVTDSAEHNMTNENTAVKNFRRSCTSSLTDSFSYENKRCDDSSDMSDCFDDTVCESDSCFMNYERNAQGVELTNELYSNHINGTKNDEYSKAELLARRSKFKSRYQQNMQITDSLPSHVRITGDDVIIASGCSSAVEMAISVLLNEGDNILVPRPGFPLYQVITESLGGRVKQYPLKPDSDWECDTEAMESLIDSSTKAILITNPSNPCGSNYSVEHLQSVIAVARKYSLPIIADEIYGGCVFDDKTHFTPICSLCDDVPILSLGGLAKEFVVPGWRVGWIAIHDAYLKPTSESTVYITDPAKQKSAMRSNSYIANNLSFGDLKAPRCCCKNCANSCHAAHIGSGDITESVSHLTNATNSYIVTNGKKAYLDCKYTDINKVNENIRRALNGTEEQDKRDNIIRNEDINKINLKDYQMNGTVDIDELLTSYINQNDFAKYSPGKYEQRKSINFEEHKAATSGHNMNNSEPMNIEENAVVWRLTEVRKGLRNLTQLTLGASSLLQSSLPRVLTPEKGSDDEISLLRFHEMYMDTLRRNTKICQISLEKIPELSMNMPKGAMYIMLKIQFGLLFDISDDKEFAEKLLHEENLSVLPGACFNMGGYLRLVTCPPENIFLDALERLKLFCCRHNFANQK